MPVISLAALKGGVGKTTSAIYLSAVSARTGTPTLLVDANPDGSAATWVELATKEGWINGVEILEAPSERLLSRALEGSSGPDELIVVDTAPNNSTMTQLAVDRADAVIVATRAGGIEIDRVAATLHLIPEGRRHGVVVCAALTGSRALVDTVTGWRNAGVPVWGAVPQRVGIGAAMTAPLHLTGLVAYAEILKRAVGEDSVVGERVDVPAGGPGEPVVNVSPADGAVGDEEEQQV